MLAVRRSTRTRSPCFRSSSFLLFVVVFVIFICVVSLIDTVHAFAPPHLGIGALLFPVRGKTITGISNLPNPNKKNELQNVSDFFVDSFWTAKVGGGARELSPRQIRQLQQSQTAEFTKRYGRKQTPLSRKRSELLVMKTPSSNKRSPSSSTSLSSVAPSRSNSIAINYINNNESGDIIGCVGVEVDRIPDGALLGETVTEAPLMSNLAVSRKYRRRGLAEELVQAVEDMVRKEWGFDECYLYVEERNRAAIKLYRKLGYRQLWRDDTAKTLLPTSSGNLDAASTVIVCMKKNFNANLFQKLFG